MEDSRISIRRNRWEGPLRALAALLGIMLGTAHAADPADAVGEGAWLIAPCPKHLAVGEWHAIRGAESAGWVPLVKEGGVARELSRSEFAELGATWEEFLEGARKEATRVLADAQVQVVRDRRDVAELAVLRSTDGSAASVLAAPKFIERFKELFGPELLVVVPNRDLVYVMSRFESPKDQITENVLSAYKNSTHPASLELFLVEESGIRAVGMFEP